MKRLLLAPVLALLCQTAFGADGHSQITGAAKQLDAKPNYSWTTTTKEADGSAGRLGQIDGKAEKSGLVYLSFSVSEIPVEVYMNGPKGAAKALEGWQTFDEIAQTSGAAAAVVRYLRGYKTPAAESADLAEKAVDLKEADGALTGALKDDAVKEQLLRFARRREGQEPKISDAKGSVKFWVKEGQLAKYEIKVQGKVSSNDRETDVNRTTTVEVKEPGSTKVEVPAEAKAKMT